jgi:cytochrome c peroxidase
MSEAARRGQELFFSERMECFHCHGGFNFSQAVNHAGTTLAQAEFHNNGLYNIGGTGDYPLDNRGLWEFTQRPADMGRFRAPTLRNIELTAPYMHDGSIATLEEVLDHYSRGGRLIAAGPLAGDGQKIRSKAN